MYVKQNKSHGRTYLNFVEGYSENNKVKHRVIEKIGYLDELEKIYPNPLEHFKKIAQERTKAAKAEPWTLDANRHMDPETDDLRYLGYFPFKKLYGELRLPTFFRNLQRNYKMSYSLNSVYLFLVMSRIISPGSVLASYNHKIRFPEKFDFTLKQVYRAYDYFYENLDKIKNRLYEAVSRIYTYDTETCRYDVTNYFFEIRYNDEDIIEDNEIKREGLRKKGCSKEHRATPVIQLGLLLDKNGIPMGYNLFPGNRSEKRSLRPLLKELKSRHSIDRVIVVADRGINTDSNCGFLAKGTGDGYIYGNSIRKEDKEFKEWALNQDDYIIEELDEIDPKTGRPVIFKHKSLTGMVNKTLTDDNGKKIGEVSVKEKVLVYYSKKYAEREKKQREKDLKKALDYTSNPGLYTKATSVGAAGYVKRVPVEEESGEEKPKKRKKTRLVIDYEKIKEQEKYDGYFSIITSEVDKSDKELRDVYKELWEIEDTFKMSKNELETRPVYMSSQEHIEVHFLICYTAILLIRLTQYKLDHKYNYEDLLDSLRNYNCCYLEQNRFTNMFNNNLMIDLGHYYNLDLSKKYITTGEIRSILKY